MGEFLDATCGILAIILVLIVASWPRKESEK